MIAVLVTGSICANAQTYGGGVSISGTNWVFAQASPGSYVTNYLSYNQPPRTLVLSGVSNTNEAPVVYYGFVVPTNYFLLPGTTNVYVTSSTNFSFLAGTNGGTTTFTFSGIYGQQVPVQGIMGINIGNNTNTAFASP